MTSSVNAQLAADVETYLDSLKKTIDGLNREEILSFLTLLQTAREEGRRIFIMGNGGSAATASHFACDFNKGLCREDKKPFKFTCLSDNVPTMMAYANDMSYDDIFIEQLRNQMEPGDVVIGISGSGNSMNVVKALEYANANQGTTFALVGYSGGKLKHIARQCIHVDLNDMQVVEDLHMVIDHMSMRVLHNA